MFRRVLFPGFLLVSLASAIAAAPAWWAARGATDANPPNDDAAVNQGQLKQFTHKAVQELNARIPGGAGSDLNGLVNGWMQAYQTGGYNAANPLPADFDAMNSGQLKWIANKVHARLVFAKYENAPPAWLVPNPGTDKQLVNLGQLKTVFNFDLTAPEGQLPSWWQKFHFNGNTGYISTADEDGDGLTNVQEFALGTNPRNSDTDEDGLGDKWETDHYLDPNDDGSTDPENGPTGDPDGDGLPNSEEISSGTDPNNSDSDGDGLLDGVENASGTGTDPNNSDSDGDGLLDGVENASGTGTDPTNSDSDGDGLLDGEDADPKEILVSWERTPESSYLLLEVTTPYEAAYADDLNDNGEVLIGGGIWAGGLWTSLAVEGNGVVPGEGGAHYTVQHGDWRFFNNDRTLLGSSHLTFTDTPAAGGDGLGAPSFRLEGQSSASLMYDTADLWGNIYWNFRPTGVTTAGEMILSVKPLHAPIGSTTATIRLDRFDASGAFAGSMDGSDGYHPANGGWRHSDVTPSGWVASNLAPSPYSSQPSAHRLGLWNAANASIALPPEANHWGYPVNVNDLPHGKVVLVGGKTIGDNYTGRIFLPDATGQYQNVPSLSALQIERFAGDGTAITSNHKLWRNGKLIPLRDLCERYGELLDAGWNLTALKSNQHGVYLIVGESPTVETKSFLLQPCRFELRDVADVAKGWDDTDPDKTKGHWTSVGVAKTKSIVKLVIPGCTAAIGALMELVAAPGAEGFLSLQNHAITGETTDFAITGTAATPAAGAKIIVREKDKPANSSKPLNVYVFEEKLLWVSIFRVWDHRVPESEVKNAPADDDIIKALDRAHQPQENVKFVLHSNSGVIDLCKDPGLPPTSPDLPGILFTHGRTNATENGKFDVNSSWRKASGLTDKVPLAGVSSRAKLTIHIVNTFTGNENLGTTFSITPNKRTSFVISGAKDRVYAHEVGHALGLAFKKVGPENTHDLGPWPVGIKKIDPNCVGLMYPKYGTAMTDWLRQEDWRLANITAKDLE